MKLTGKFVVIMFTFAFVLASAYIAHAGTDQQSAQGTSAGISSNGAARVDRDFEAYHRNDTNQFGDDRAYNSSDGHMNKESDYSAHHWTPETYGLSGDYGYDSRH